MDSLQEYLDQAADNIEGLKGDDRAAYDSLEFFSEYVMGYGSGEYRKPSEFLRKIYSTLQHSVEKYLLILGPRGSAKSTAVTVNYVCWSLGRNPLLRFLLVFAAKDTQGKPFSNQIAGVIENNDRYKKIFGELAPTDAGTPWSADARTVKRPEPPGGLKDSSITIGGIGSNLPSKRADEAILDDLVTADNAYSQIKQDAIESYVFQTVFPILVPGGRRIIVGSRWDERDLYSRVATKWGLTMPQPDYEIDLDMLRAQILDIQQDMEIVEA